jgi:O-antigen/teichoic acid export membrane protein
MFARLAKNTFITGGSFLITGVVPLLLVPLLVHQYGMTQYGLLVLARLLLPTGALAFLDFGNSETAGYAVARARYDADWAACGRMLSGLMWLNIAAGLSAGMLVYLLAPQLAEVFGVEATQRNGFVVIVRATAVVLPVLFVSLAAEGVMRGFEAFRSLRTIDVTTTFAFAGMAYAAVYFGLGYAWVGLAYVAYTLLRASALLVKAHRLLRRDGFGLRTAPQPAEWRDLRSRCLPLGANRLIGVGQAHASPLLIGALLGPAAVGLFDIVVRIPRFLKIVTGVLNTAVLPIVMRFDQAKDQESVRRLFDLGLLGVLCLVTPLVAWCMTFSEAVLRMWVSERFAILWPWQALLFLWPLINTVTSFTCGSLLGRPDFVRTLNWIVLGQICAQIVLSLLAMQYVSEQGFVVGQIAALSLSFPLQMALVFRHSGIGIAAFRRHLRLLAGSAAITAVGIAAGLSGWVHHPLWLAASLVAWMAAACIIIWFTLVAHEERAAIAATVTARFQRRARP